MEGPPPLHFPVSSKVEIIELKNYFEEYFQNMPPCIKELPDDLRYKINNIVSLVFLNGKVVMDHAGISSPHLQGAFYAAVRREKTGFFLIDDVNYHSFDQFRPQLEAVYQWLKENNPLYENGIEADVGQLLDCYSLVMETKPNVVCFGIISDPQLNATEFFDPNPFKVRIKVKLGEEYEWKTVTLEQALCFMFPILFPYGKVPEIPGKTIREKAQNLLSAHPYLRIGRTACSMLLWKIGRAHV